MLLVLDRDLDNSPEYEVNWRSGAPSRVLTSVLITGTALKAENNFDNPNTVVPTKQESPPLRNRTTIQVPAKSYSLFVFQTA